VPAGLSFHGAAILDAVALALNARPWKTLGWCTPAEAFATLLRSVVTTTVATTD
jgi:IS30 family transposase